MFFPMGAKKTDTRKFKELLSLKSYIAQEKIDGVRALLTFDEEGRMHFTTRGATLANPEVPIDITHRMYNFRYKIPSLANTILDCEVDDPELDSAEVAGILNYRSMVSVPNTLRLRVFDILKYRGVELILKPLSTRMGYLENLFKLSEKIPTIQFLPWYYNNIEKVLEDIWLRGGEGIVLKNINSAYYPNAKKANTWYKVKQHDTVDAKITGSEPPEQFYRDPDTGVYDFHRPTKPWACGWFGAIKYRLEDGTEGTVSGLTDKMKQTMSGGNHNILQCYIGQWMELEYMQKTSDGNLRHPRFKRLRQNIEKG